MKPTDLNETLHNDTVIYKKRFGVSAQHIVLKSGVQIKKILITTMNLNPETLLLPTTVTPL